MHPKIISETGANWSRFGAVSETWGLTYTSRLHLSELTAKALPRRDHQPSLASCEPVDEPEALDRGPRVRPVVRDEGDGERRLHTLSKVKGKRHRDHSVRIEREPSLYKIKPILFSIF